MLSKCLVVAAAALMPVSQAFLTSHFFVDCGSESTIETSTQYCYYDQDDGNYYTAPRLVVAYEGDDFLSCYTDANLYASDGQFDCEDATGNTVCTDITSTWTNLYTSAANVQYTLNGPELTSTLYLGCDTHDETTYQLLCHAQTPTETNTYNNDNSYMYCAPDGSLGTTGRGTWSVAFYDSGTCQSSAYAIEASLTYESESCGDASTVTQSALVTILSLVVALKAVF